MTDALGRIIPVSTVVLFQNRSDNFPSKATIIHWLQKIPWEKIMYLKSVNFKNVSNCSKGTVLITEAGCQAIKIKKSTLVGDLMQINVVGSR